MHENNWKRRWRGAWLSVQCRGETAVVANNWSLHHECYWEALLILSSSFWESCKGVETATTSKPVRLLCVISHASPANAQERGLQTWKNSLLFNSWKLCAFSVTSVAVECISCCLEREGLYRPRYVIETFLLVSALCTRRAEVIQPPMKIFWLEKLYPYCLPIEVVDCPFFVTECTAVHTHWTNYMDQNLLLPNCYWVPPFPNTSF